MQYRNLDLEAFDYHRAEDGVGRFRVRVTGSPAGEQKHANAEEVTIPPDLRKRLRRLEKRTLDLPRMIALGEDLAGLLFPPRARELLMLSRAGLDDDEGLRIRLKVHTYALADLPWEYVYIPRPDTPPDQKGLDGFLVLDRRVSLVRYEVMGQRLVSLDPVGAGPLRLVVLLADPDTPGYPHLDLDVERQNIEQALEEVPEISAEFYPDATVETLEDALTREAHVFHFSGHGQFEGDLGVAFGSVEGEGSVVLVGDDGGPFPFAAEKLAQNLRGRGVRLAVLGACEVGHRDQVNAWTGVVPALTRAGIPAVVGMQYTIRDRNAVAFSRRFYRALAAGQPIDAAVTDGRLAIFNRSGDDERDWGVPVLYLRTGEGVLFPSARTAPQAEPRDAVQGPVTSIRVDQHVGTVEGGKVVGVEIGQPATLPIGQPAPSPSSKARKELEEQLEEFARPVSPPPAGDVDKRALREVMVQSFGLEDLEVLCADVEEALKDDGLPLQVNLEIVGGSGKRSKVLNLIQHLDRRGYLGYLVEAVRQHRPGLI
jgi:hypothetical protein